MSTNQKKNTDTEDKTIAPAIREKENIKMFDVIKYIEFKCEQKLKKCLTKGNLDGITKLLRDG